MAANYSTRKLELSPYDFTHNEEKQKPEKKKTCQISFIPWFEKILAFTSQDDLQAENKAQVLQKKKTNTKQPYETWKK